MLLDAVKLVTAALLGAIIGLQREFKDRPAGLRTHTLVSLASCLFTLISISAFSKNADPSRIAANVAVGIGFIGAGTIIKQGNIIVGLTTAASLWMVAAIGVSVGAGNYFLAVAATILALIVLTLLKWAEERIGKKKQVLMEIEVKSSDADQLIEIWKSLNAEEITLAKEEESQKITVSVRAKDEKEIRDLIEKASLNGILTKVQWR